MMKNVVRATPVAILAAGVFSGQAHATTETVSGCSFDLDSYASSDCDVLLGSALGQSSPQFQMAYQNTSLVFYKEHTTFSVSPGKFGTINGGSSFVWQENPSTFDYQTEALPVTFRIKGTSYAGDANFTLTGRTFSLDSVDYNASGPAVPEPATWAMIILGMGAVGAAARRARRQSTATA